MRQKSADFVKYYGKLSNFALKKILLCTIQIRWSECAAIYE